MSGRWLATKETTNMGGGLMVWKGKRGSHLRACQRQLQSPRPATPPLHTHTRPTPTPHNALVVSALPPLSRLSTA